MPVKATYICYECAFSQDSTKSKLATAIVTDKDYLISKCKFGHMQHLYTNIPKYAYLYENGLKAYSEENYYECFSSLYAALENAWLVYIESNMWLNFDKSFEFLDILKESKLHRSERIQGAFIDSYIRNTKRVPPKLSNRLVQARNEIIHGMIPPNNELCEKAIEKIYSVIHEIEAYSIIDVHGYITRLPSYYYGKYSEYKKSLAPEVPGVKQMIVSDHGHFILGSHRVGTPKQFLESETLHSTNEILKKSSFIPTIFKKQLS
ncbi:hypothetical protein NB814_01090 [Latilactobacillus curvatus]|uniref:hypothetical protein n=1 Tax=Latilactobacillus curvatus TaxID=28038 RepID=UPI0020302058|nr:hypothetical protein [Latilactobacillus curvatus]MCM0724349.1 hypothetical protein [Latilactobacillus curvatus]